MRFLPSLFSYLFLHLVSFSLQCQVCVLLYCVLTVLCQVALTLGWGFAHPLHDLRVYCEERECIANLNK